MGKKGRLIFGILILVLVPVFAFGIWKEFGIESDNDFQENLNKKVTQSALSSQSTAPNSNQANSSITPVSPQDKISSPDVPKVAAAENTTQNSSENTAQGNPADSTEKQDNSTDNSTDKNNYENKKLGISFDYSKDYSVAFDGSKTITVSKGNVSWKMKLYDNKNKEDIQTWFGNHFNQKDNLDCSFLEPEIKAGTYEGKLVKSSIDKGKCADGGSYAINSDKTKVIRIYEGTETKENINSILTSFKFL